MDDESNQAEIVELAPPLPTQRTDRQVRDHETEEHRHLREEYFRRMVEELGEG